MIEIRNLHKSYGAQPVIRGIDLTITKGEVLCLIGASGSGKSTLLQCINGLEPIDSGQILVDGIEVHARGTNINQLRQKLGLVFQQYNAFPHLTALENVALAPRIVKGMSRAQARELAREHLAYVGLGDKVDAKPARLSGGQQQRLAIARALAMAPDYMLFGEVLDTIRKLKARGLTLIMVTHDIGFARESADRVAFFDQGHICEIGAARQVICEPREERTRQFLQRVLS